PRTRKIVNVVGFTVEEYGEVVAGLEIGAGNGAGGPANYESIDAYGLNVSCPNPRAGGVWVGADPPALRAVVDGGRGATRRPLCLKLSTSLADIADTARLSADAGADGITLVNTIPGLVVDVERRRSALGFGTGGVSGTALLPVGVLATWKVRRAV